MNGERIIKYLDESNEFPVLNKEIVDVIKMIDNSDTLNIDKLVEKVSKCDDLGERFLSNINNGYFSLSRKIESIKDAIVFLGMNTVKKLILAYLIEALLPKSEGRSNQLSREKYWEHCLGTSIAATMIAEKMGIQDKYRFFAYGLIHDIGVTVLDIYLPEIINEVVDLQYKGLHQIVAERLVMKGFTHAHVGAWLCKRWRLPNDVFAIVGHHHTPILAEEYKKEVRILSIADLISTSYYERLFNINSPLVINEKMAEPLSITMKDIEEIVENLPREVEEASKLFT